ncbi:MAG TPA: Gfo/Idh/MocA family oxidoreductase [Acidobacteriaceae bacterium]
MQRTSRRLRLGMVGGGPGAFIGPVHKMAAELDGQMRLVAGAFSQSAEKSQAAGISYGLEPGRAYASYEAMFAEEAKREDGVEVVAIVTPNHLHLPVAKAALAAGLHVISDKPATATLEEALELAKIVEQTGKQYALTFTYTGYPMVRAARDLVASGKLGKVRKIAVEYFQGWMTEPLEETGHKQAAWRADPLRSGIGGATGDIGVHAFNLLEYVTQLRVESLCSDVRSVVAGRALDDDATVLARLNNGAHAVIAVSQIAAGERNGIRLRVWGELGGLDWSHENPSLMHLRWVDGREEILHAGTAQLSVAAKAATRLPVGHPEGLIEAFGNIYRDFAAAVIANDAKLLADATAYLCGVEDGVRSMAFVEAAVRGAALNWEPLPVE